MPFDERKMYVSGINWETKKWDGKSFIKTVNISIGEKFAEYMDVYLNISTYCNKNKTHIATAEGSFFNAGNGGGWYYGRVHAVLIRLEEAIKKDNSVLKESIEPFQYSLDLRDDLVHPEKPLVKCYIHDTSIFGMELLEMAITKNGTVELYFHHKGFINVGMLDEKYGFLCTKFEIPASTPYKHVYYILIDLYEAMVEDYNYAMDRAGIKNN